ncbi:MAG TPA: hypothetical protein VHG30_17465 [Microvirga sp.]|nr:hypothetical protein [Microvirga sp.]
MSAVAESAADAGPERAPALAAAAPAAPPPADGSDEGGGMEAAGSAAVELAALAPEVFLDPNEAETFAWIASDLAAAGELATGSLPTVPSDGGSGHRLQDENALSFAEPAVAPAHRERAEQDREAALEP